jgi:hypothetical protein
MLITAVRIRLLMGFTFEHVVELIFIIAILETFWVYTKECVDNFWLDVVK